MTGRLTIQHWHEEQDRAAAEEERRKQIVREAVEEIEQIVRRHFRPRYRPTLGRRIGQFFGF